MRSKITLQFYWQWIRTRKRKGHDDQEKKSFPLPSIQTTSTFSFFLSSCYSSFFLPSWVELILISSRLELISVKSGSRFWEWDHMRRSRNNHHEHCHHNMIQILLMFFFNKTLIEDTYFMLSLFPTFHSQLNLDTTFTGPDMAITLACRPWWNRNR